MNPIARVNNRTSAVFPYSFIGVEVVVAVVAVVADVAAGVTGVPVNARFSVTGVGELAANVVVCVVVNWASWKLIVSPELQVCPACPQTATV